MFWIFLELRTMEVVGITAAIRRAKLTSHHHHQQTNTQLFTGRTPFLLASCVKALKRQCHITQTWSSSSPEEVVQPCLWPSKAPDYLGGDCQACRQPFGIKTTMMTMMRVLY